VTAVDPEQQQLLASTVHDMEQQTLHCCLTVTEAIKIHLHVHADWMYT